MIICVYDFIFIVVKKLTTHIGGALFPLNTEYQLQNVKSLYV